MQPAHQRAVGNHRSDAGKLRRIGPPLRDTADEVDQLGQHRDLRQVERPLEDRDVGVETLAGQQGAARWASGAHDAVDHDVLIAQVLDQGREHALLLVERGLQFLAGGCGQAIDHPAGQLADHEQLAGCVVKFLQACGACQHLGDQPAARMRHQVQPRPRRAGQCQCVGVGDRAFAERGVVERVDAVAIVVKQGLHTLRVLLPQLAKGAQRVGKRAVHEHQQRPAIGDSSHRVESGLALQAGQRIGLQRVDAFDHLAVNTLNDLVGREVLRGFAQRTGDHLDQVQKHRADPPARHAAGAGRRCIQPRPAQLRRHLDLVGRCTACHRPFDAAGAGPG